MTQMKGPTMQTPNEAAGHYETTDFGGDVTAVIWAPNRPVQVKEPEALEGQLKLPLEERAA